MVRVVHADGTPYLTLTGHTPGSVINSVNWSPDSTRVISASTDFTVRIWNVAQPDHQPGELLATLTRHKDIVEDVAWSPDGTMIASVSSIFTITEDNIKIWDGNNYTFLREGPGPNIYNMAWSPDSTKIALAAYAGLQIIDVATLGENYRQDNFSFIAFSVDWYDNQVAVGTATEDRTSINIRVYDVASAPYTELKIFPTLSVEGVTWSPDGKRLASVGSGSVDVWDWQNGRLLESYPIIKTSLTTHMAWKPDGSQLAYGDTGVTPQIVTLPVLDSDDRSEAAEVSPAVTSSPEADLP